MIPVFKLLFTLGRKGLLNPPNCRGRWAKETLLSKKKEREREEKSYSQELLSD